MPLPELLLCMEPYTPRHETRELGADALVVKDYAKSLKHDWHEACFVPDARDDDALWRVVSRFLALRDDAIEGGLVLRDYVPLLRNPKQPECGNTAQAHVLKALLPKPSLRMLLPPQ